MSFNYSGAPTEGTTDEIRFLLQDTNETSAIFQDEEIQYFIDKMATVNTSAVGVAALLAETAAAKFAREVSISSDQTSIAMEQLQTKYEQLAGRLRAMEAKVDAKGTGPIVGGLNDDDRFWGGAKRFRIGMGDNPWAGDQDSPENGPFYNYEYGGLYNN